MTEQQIYILMVETPNIVAAQIAGALNRKLSDVSQMMRQLVAMGDVERSDGVGPDGLQAQVYNLSAGFKRTRHYQNALLAVDADKRAAPATTPTALAETVDSAPIQIQPEATRADRGVAYVTKMQRAVSQQEMRNAMGLNASQYPAAFMVTAIRDGKLHKDGSMWKAGPAPSDQVARTATDAPKPDAPVDRAPSAQPAVHATPLAATVFRCGLWSDGVLELQRNGTTVVVLKQNEGEQLASFVNRMLIDPLGSAVQTSTQR